MQSGRILSQRKTKTPSLESAFAWLPLVDVLPNLKLSNGLATKDSVVPQPSKRAYITTLSV